MSSFDVNQFLEELGINPVKLEHVSPVTGEVVKRSAPTSLRDSFAIVSNNLQKHYDSKPKPVMEDEVDYDYEVPSKKDKELIFFAGNEVCKINTEYLMKYLEDRSNDYTPKTLYIERIDTTIIYGEISNTGERLEAGRFEISNDGVLQAIYELLRVRFADGFKEQVTIGINGWTLAPYISFETEVNVSSNRLTDMEWILREKEVIQDKKRKGLFN